MGGLVYHTNQFPCDAWAKFEGKSKMSGDEKADKQQVNADETPPSVSPKPQDSPTSHSPVVNVNTRKHCKVLKEHDGEKLGAFLAGLIPVVISVLFHLGLLLIMLFILNSSANTT